MNRAYIFYGWKIEPVYALNVLASYDADEMYSWFNTELAPNVYLSHACPANGLSVYQSDFYITLGPTRDQPYDPDDMFDLIRDRKLLQSGWEICKEICHLPHDVKMSHPEIFAVVHFY